MHLRQPLLVGLGKDSVAALATEEQRGEHNGLKSLADVGIPAENLSQQFPGFLVPVSELLGIEGNLSQSRDFFQLSPQEVRIGGVFIGGEARRILSAGG